MRPSVLALAIACSALFAALTASATSAGSLRTFQGHFSESGQFQDDGATAACGFPVTFGYSTNVTFADVFDATGTTFLHGVLIPTGTVTESANGITLSGRTEDNQIYFATTQTVYEVGLVDTFMLPGSGVIQIDVGRIVWPFASWFNGGPPTVVEGPHQSLEGDFGDLCAALTA